VATTCLAVRRAALRLAGTVGSSELMIRIHPEVARALRGEERSILEELERELATRILLQEDAQLHRAGFDILEV
jgi:Ribonuclease G/E